jgi:hypothetical protein
MSTTAPSPEELQANLTDLTAKDKETIKKEVTEMEKLNRERLNKAEADLAEMEAGQVKKGLGLDLPFDIKKFVQEGIIFKKDVRIFDDMFADMQTLNHVQRIMAATLVQEVMGDMPLGQPYNLALSAATVSLSIVRLNNTLFPMPNFFDRRTEEYKNFYARKKNLLQSIFQSAEGMVAYLQIIYDNLELASLMDEDAKKKSSQPGNPNDSGSSVTVSESSPTIP